MTWSTGSRPASPPRSWRCSGPAGPARSGGRCASTRPRHPSPNAGVVEAAFAAALDLRLGGVNRYGDRVEERAALGRGRAPTASDIAAAVRLSRQLAGAMIAGLAVAAAAPSVVRRLREA